MFKRNKLEKFLISLSGFLFLIIFALGIKSKEDGNKLNQLNGTNATNSVSDVQAGPLASSSDYSTTQDDNYYSDPSATSQPSQTQTAVSSPVSVSTHHRTRTS